MWKCVKGSGRAKEKPEIKWSSLDTKSCTRSICPKGPKWCWEWGGEVGTRILRKCSIGLMHLAFKSYFSDENIPPLLSWWSFARHCALTLSWYFALGVALVTSSLLIQLYSVLGFSRGFSPMCMEEVFMALCKNNNKQFSELHIQHQPIFEKQCYIIHPCSGKTMEQ